MRRVLGILTAWASASVLIVSAGGGSADAQVLSKAPVGASTCVYSSARHLESIKVVGPLVHEQRTYARRHLPQYVRYNAALQALEGSTWVSVPGAGKQRIPELNTWNASTWKALPQVTVNVPAGLTASAYRISATIRWYKPVHGTSQHVTKTRHHLLTAYTGGATSCLANQPAPAPKPAPGQQSIGVSAGSAVVSTGQSFAAAFTATGVKGSESVVTTLYGPSTSKDGCTGPVAQQSTTAVSASGTYPIAAVSESVSGYYFWGVSAAGNSELSSASACAPAAVTVRKPTTTSITLGNRYLSKPITAAVTISGVDRQTSGTWLGVLWGPYDTKAAADAAHCTGTAHTTLAGNVPVSVAPGVTTHVSLSDTVNKVAFWRWGATFSGSDLESSSTYCLATFHTLNQ